MSGIPSPSVSTSPQTQGSGAMPTFKTCERPANKASESGVVETLIVDKAPL